MLDELAGLIRFFFWFTIAIGVIIGVFMKGCYDDVSNLGSQGRQEVQQIIADARAAEAAEAANRRDSGHYTVRDSATGDSSTADYAVTRSKNSRSRRHRQNRHDNQVNSF